MTVSYQVRGDQYVVDYLAKLPVELMLMIQQKFAARAQNISNYIKGDLLSGQLLGVKSGRLRASIVARVYNSKAKVTLSVASRGDVPYARIYEEGGKIPPHIIRAKNGGLLVFRGAYGDLIGVPQVNHPGVSVRPREYLRRGIEDRYVDFLSDIGSAIYDASAKT